MTEREGAGVVVLRKLREEEKSLLLVLCFRRQSAKDLILASLETVMLL